jgi:hypothetical protein
MRVRWIVLSIVAFAAWKAWTQQPPEPPGNLVREVVSNEQHDHQLHGYWRYWIAFKGQQNQIEEQIETADGPVTRLVASDGHALNQRDQQQEQERLNRLLGSADEQARHRQEFGDDERRIGRILALLPDAFVYQYDGMENGCYRLRFGPNPNYPAHSVEARIFHAVSGTIWVEARFKRLTRLDGQLQENVDFGYGILGRLYKGGWFRLQRRQVSATDWKTERLEIHISGRALLFKTIARETSQTRGGFASVPTGLTLAEGMKLLVAQSVTASVTPEAFPSMHLDGH